MGVSVTSPSGADVNHSALRVASTISSGAETNRGGDVMGFVSIGRADVASDGCAFVESRAKCIVEEEEDHI